MIPQETPPSSATSAPASNSSIIALVLGILGLTGCAVLGPIAWFMGQQELKRIRQGLSPFAGELPAKVGMILGIVSSIVLLLVVFAVLLFGIGIFASVFQAIVHS